MLPVTTYAKLPGVKEKTYACYGCIAGCARTLAETSDGKRSKRVCTSGSFYQVPVRGYYGEYNDVVIQANRLIDQYGLDAKAVEATINLMSRCYEAGILTDEGTGIPISKIGSLEFIETMVQRISLREGFGDVLAQGPIRAARSVGGEALITGTPESQGRPFTFDPRTYITTGVMWATEPRAAMGQMSQVGGLIAHWVGWAIKYVVPLDSLKAGQQHPLAHRLVIDDVEALKAVIQRCQVSSDVVREVARRFWGSEVAADFSTYDGKALAAKKIQDRSYAKDCLILCSIGWPSLQARYSGVHVGDPTIESKLLSAVTGREVDAEELERVGERVFNLQRAILAREGRGGRERDKLPELCYTTPLSTEAYNMECLVPGKKGEIISRKGAVLDREQFEGMMDEYYQLRGWDVATGLQTKAKLEELGLRDIVTDLEQRGLIA